MKVTSKRWVAAFLAVMMLVSLLSINAFAATPENVKQYGNYVSLGDSVGSGFGMPEYNRYGKMVCDEVLMKRISGAYPDLVATWTGANLTQLCMPGYTSAALRYELDDSFEMNEWELYELSNFTFGYYDQEYLDENKSTFREAVTNADLITLDIGLNDTWYSSIALVYYVAEDGSIGPFDPRETLEKELENYGTWGTVVRNAMYLLAGLAENPDKWSTYVSMLITNLSNYLTVYQENYEAIVTKIFEYNPDVTVVAVGIANPFKEWEIIPGVGGNYKIQLYDGGPVKVDLPIIGEFILPDEVTLSPTAAMLAQGMYDLTYTSARKYFTKVYPGQYLYADVSDADLIGKTATIPLYENSTLDDSGFNPHPTAEGHEYIAEQIVAQLPERDTSAEENCPSEKFTDLDTSAWYHEPVDYVLNKGIMAGMSENTFEPESNVTRAQVATMLYAMENKPAVSSTAGFSDVSEDAWYADPVNWAAANGVVAGMGDGTFQPDTAVTREQLATMLRSYASYKGKDVSANGDISTFADASSVSTWATENVSWAVGNGIIGGRPGNLIAPQGTATRAETATMFMQFCKKVIG